MSLSPMKTIQEQWLKKFKQVEAHPEFRRLMTGDITPKQYASLMRQIFHHARENPQIQTLATVYFRGRQREVIKSFFKHATSEIGHDQLALDDLKTLGVPTEGIPWERPLPATTALLAFPFYQIQHLDPIGYLGYLLHLEFMPTRVGAQVVQALMAAGIPREAMSFIHDHSTIDVGHNKLMELYVDKLVHTPSQIDTVVYAAEVTADLYTTMIAESFRLADTEQSTGLSPYERVAEPATRPSEPAPAQWN